MQLRHILEVHAVDAGDQGRGYANHADHGHHLDDVALVDGDEAEHGIEEELQLLGQVIVEVAEGGDVEAQGLQPRPQVLGKPFGRALGI